MRNFQMENIKQALYQQTRLTILLTAKDGHENSPFSTAYLHAWDSNVYPALDEGADWHKPHEAEFKVSEKMVDELHGFLADCWNDKKPLTFYDLEAHYDARHGNTEWDRSVLVDVCRYFYLHGHLFDSEFWDKLTENGTCPSEAHSIRADFHSIYFQ